MTAETELVTWLHGVVEHNRVMPKLIDVDTALPAVAYQRISSRPMFIHGKPPNEWIRWQLTIVAKTYLNARAQAERIKSAIEQFSGVGNIYRLKWENDSDGAQGFITENEPVRLDVIMNYCKQSMT